MSDPIVMPPMLGGQLASWHAVLDLYERQSVGWTVVGGQMVHLWCAERGHRPQRPTDDIDTILDIRTYPGLLRTVTELLQLDGFGASTSADGLQHRWVRHDAVIDVMLADGVGRRSRSRGGAGGGRTIEAPGGTQALDRTEIVTVQVADRIGCVPRPDLLGALVIKAAAHAAGGGWKGRHRTDFVVLATLAGRVDVQKPMNRKDRQRLRGMVVACRADPSAMSIDGADAALRRLELALG